MTYIVYTNYEGVWTIGLRGTCTTMPEGLGSSHLYTSTHMASHLRIIGEKRICRWSGGGFST